MRIQRIKLQNYRQYQEADFQFQKGRPNDLNIIVGRNTLGKTDFLNSITWCLYGEEPHLGMAINTLPILNLDTLKATNPGEACSVKVIIELLCSNGFISIEREANFRIDDSDHYLITPIKTAFSVCTTVDNNTKVVENKDADDAVKRFFPKGLQEFFFFDGEQLTKYFTIDKRIKIENAINEISQVGLLNSVSDHLSSVISDIKRKTGRANPDMQRYLDENEVAQKNFDQVDHDLQECRNQIEHSEERIRTYNEFLRGQLDVVELEEKRTQLLNRKGELQEKKDQANENLKNFIREYSTYIYLYPRIRETLDLIKEKEKKGNLPPNIDKTFLRLMIEKDKCLVCMNKLDDKGKENIFTLLNSLEYSSTVSTRLVGIKGYLENVEEKIKNYKVEKARILNELNDIEKDEKELIKEFSRIESQLSSISDQDALALAITDRKKHEKLREDNLLRLGGLVERYKNAQIEKQKTENEYNDALMRNADQALLRDLMKFAEQSREITDKAKTELMDEMKEKTRLMMQELFLQLTWSRTKYSEVTIDQNYSVGLMHVDGYECLGSCAASERALLALSFTLALHRVSGFDAPLVIDTPGANISDKNRVNFANTLKEISEDKQIILLFTPSEYADEINDVFDPMLANKMQLKTSDDGRTVSVERI